MAQAWRTGDISTIGGFAPCDAVNERRLVRLAQVEYLFARHGVKVQYASNARLMSASGQIEVRKRVDDIHELFACETVDIMISLCGGKGCGDLLPLLDFGLLAKMPKPIFGFSNASVLLNALTAKTGQVTYYGPESLNRFAFSENFLNQLLLEWRREREYGAANSAAITQGSCSGILIGGNLSSYVESIAGTQFDVAGSQRILFWESGTDDPIVSRDLLERLLQDNFQDRIVGMLVGEIGTSPSADRLEALIPTIRKFGVPTLWCPIFGHYRDGNAILPIGGFAHLNVEACSLHINQ